MTFIPMRCIARGRVAATVFAVLAALLVPGSWAKAQEPLARMRHVALREMSTADRAILQAHRTDIMEGAEIYGYNLVEGDWIVRQTLCPSIPNSILLHYSQYFPDGTESLFTALVPRGTGRVRIVPVLHHNATPYIPAPRNPRNYSLFNSLVPRNIAQQDLASNGNWIELSACYAEMTGADIKVPRGGSIDAGVAGAPTATIHLDPRSNSALITFADRESRQSFRVWSISFDRAGRVTAAGTEAYPVIQPPIGPQQGAERREQLSTSQPMARPEEMSAASGRIAKQHSAPSAREGGPAPSQSARAGARDPEAPPTKAAARVSASETSGPGWKFIPEPPPPTSRFIPQTPPPPSKVDPQPEKQ